MPDSVATMTFVDDLLAGPRGRRLLLEFALASDSRMGEGSLHHAVFHAGHHLDPDKERISFFTIGDTGMDSPTRPVIAAETVAEKIAVVSLAEPTAELLREVLQTSVEQAMYWQRPEGTDVLAATGPGAGTAGESRRAPRRYICCRLVVPGCSTW